MTGNGADVANVVRDTIYRATLLLDDQQWEQWLDLCDDSFHYAIKSFSPEINRDMTYFQGSRKDLATMVKLLPKHNTDHSPLRRHATVYTVDVAEDGKTASAIASFVVYQNYARRRELAHRCRRKPAVPGRPLPRYAQARARSGPFHQAGSASRQPPARQGVALADLSNVARLGFLRTGASAAVASGASRGSRDTSEAS